MATKGQKTALATVISVECHVNDRPHRLAIVSRILGQPVTSMNDLMADEAGRVLDWLATLQTADEVSELVEQCRPAAVRRDC
jgi:hypothetical protein